MIRQPITAEERARFLDAKGRAFQWSIERCMQGQWVPLKSWRSAALTETSTEARLRYQRRFPHTAHWQLRAIKREDT